LDKASGSARFELRIRFREPTCLNPTKLNRWTH
jgi:hypothetical protein